MTGSKGRQLPDGGDPAIFGKPHTLIVQRRDHPTFAFCFTRPHRLNSIGIAFLIEDFPK
jgi:hypothetical protein